MGTEDKGKAKTDYAGNSKAGKQAAAAPKAEPKKIVSGEVKTKKKPLGTKFRETFLATDAKTVAQYVVNDVILPSARDMLFDAIAKGTGRMMYGERGGRAGMGVGGMGGGKTNYAAPVNRTFQGVQTVPFGQRMFQQTGAPNPEAEGFIISSREEADAVIDGMNEWLQEYQVISVYQVKKMLGLVPAHTDQKWGWTNLQGAQMKQVPQGWLMELPTPKVIG